MEKRRNFKLVKALYGEEDIYPSIKDIPFQDRLYTVDEILSNKFDAKKELYLEWTCDDDNRVHWTKGYPNSPTKYFIPPMMSPLRFYQTNEKGQVITTSSHEHI